MLHNFKPNCWTSAELNNSCNQDSRIKTEKELSVPIVKAFKKVGNELFISDLTMHTLIISSK